MVKALSLGLLRMSATVLSGIKTSERRVKFLPFKVFSEVCDVSPDKPLSGNMAGFGLLS